MSSIIFPLRTNIKSFQKWGDNFDISRRIKQSIIIFDEIILEAGTFKSTFSEEIAFEGFEPWSKSNTRESALKEIEKIENRPDESYITHFDGKTQNVMHKWKVYKRDEFFADYRTIDLVAEIESGSYGKKIDFIKYAIVLREEDHDEELHKNIDKNLRNNEFAKIAQKIYGNMALIQLLRNLNDSLALSQVFKSPVTVDAIHAPLLRAKAEYEIGKTFSLLDRLSEIDMPNFGNLDLDKLLQLRKDKSIRSFRNWIQTMSSKLQSDHTNEIDTLVIKELLKEIKEIAPDKKGICIEAALGGLSSIPIPFVSIITTFVDVGKELKKYDDFSKSWLSFILRSAK